MSVFLFVLMNPGGTSTRNKTNLPATKLATVSLPLTFVSLT